MGSTAIKLAETIRTVHEIKKLLRSYSDKGEYHRGVYNGFEWAMSLLEKREAVLSPSATSPETEEKL